jgi:Family of unknown function (DUF5762)
MSDNVSIPNISKFWIEDPCILFTDLVFFPTANMTREEKLNALTRLAIVITIGLYAMNYDYWLIFLLLAILLIIIAQYTSKYRETREEGFTIVPTRIGDDFQSTVVAPLFAEEQRVPPPAYDMYSNVEFVDIPFEEPIRPQAFPYGQYLTSTNLLPSDEYYIRQNPTGGAKSAREYVNSAFMRHDMANRENLTRIYKKSLQRRFRHNYLNDNFSPFHSY